MHIPINRITHTTTFLNQVVVHRLERKIAQMVHHEGSSSFGIHVAVIIHKIVIIARTRNAMGHE